MMRNDPVLLDREYSWHPFTQMAAWIREEPLLITRGAGRYVYDRNGRQYFDGYSSLWCNLFGHRVPEIDRAITEQLEKIAHSTWLGCANEPASRLVAKLAGITPGNLKRTFFSDSGSAAVEIAIKMAFQYFRQTERNTKRTKFVGLGEAYHGDTLGAVAMGGIGLFHSIFEPLLFEKITVPTPNAYRRPDGMSVDEYGAFALSELEAVFERHGEEIAAFVIEPLMQGAAGMLRHPAGYLAKVRELCDRSGALLIADEVATGFGRSGRMFACEIERVAPDIICLAKGLTGGYLPLAATVTTEKIFSGFLGEYDQYRAFYHGHTYTANQLGCAAANATLDLLTRADILENVRCTADVFAAKAAELTRAPHVGDVRMLGIMGGVEIVRDKERRTPCAPAGATGRTVVALLCERGLLTRNLGDVIVINPPLTTTADEAAWIADTIGECIALATERR